MNDRLPKGLHYYDGKYVINKLIDGERLYKRLGKVSEQEAIKQFSIMVSDHSKGVRDKPDASSLTVYSVLDYYYNSHLCNLKSGSDAKWHIPVIDRIMGSKKVLQLKKTDIEQFKLIRSKEVNNRGEPISKRTVQAGLQLLSMAINRAVDDELLPRNPIARFCTVSVPRKKKVVLDHGQELGKEWIDLYINFPKQWKLFFLICYETGMRPTEVAQLEVEWIKPIGDSYMIDYPASHEKTEFNDRRIPISKRLEKRLVPKLPAKGRVFVSWDYFKAFRQAVKDAGLPSEVTAYSLRRTRATIWDAIDSSAARVALGHAPLDPHEESYVVITNQRLFKLVSVDLTKQIKIYKTA